MKISKNITILTVMFVLAVFGAVVVSTALQPDYIVDGDTVYTPDNDNVYISTTPHTICGEGWVASKFIFKTYNGTVDVAYGFNTSSIKPIRAEYYCPHNVNYTTQHQMWFYNVSSIANTDEIPDYGNGDIKRKITYQKCNATNELTMECTEYEDVTAVVACDSFKKEGNNYTAYWHTQQTRNEDWKDISHLFQAKDFDYGGKNIWYCLNDNAVEVGKTYTIRTYIKVIEGSGGKYDVAVKPSSMTWSYAIDNGYFYILDPWAEVSELEFIDPTPANESTIYVDHTTVNVSIATSDLTYFTFNWNGTNYTYTTCGAEWNQSADSYERTTTVGTYTQPDFNNIFPWSHVRRCTLWDNGTVNYYLDAANSSLKANGELADLTGIDGQVMVQIPKFYYSHTFVDSTHDWEISRFNISGFTVHNAFIKNGEEVDYRYIGAYEGSMWDASEGAMVPSGSIVTNMYAAGDKLCSISGEYPKTNEKRSEFRTMAIERGTGWRQQDFDLISAVQLLYLIEYADFNSQSQVGYGRTQLSGGTWTAGSYIGQCGKSNVDGDKTNSVAGNTSDAYMTYRGIENFYGNVWKWVDGININNNIPYVTNNDSNFADDTTTNYTNLSITLPNANGYQVTLADTNRGFLPASIGGGSSTYITDYYYPNTGWRVVTLGGNADYGAYAGAFYVKANDAASYDLVSIAGRLAY